MLLEGNLQSVQHLGIFVPDIEKAKAWYTTRLGCQVTYEPVIHTPDGDIKLAFLNLNGMVLELVQLTPKDLDEVRTRTHGHIDHMAIDVCDAAAAMQEMLGRGAELHPEVTPDGPLSFPIFEKGVRYVFFKGPFGEKVEMAQALHLDPRRRTANIGAWNHLGIMVTDLERSKAFYSQFGFKEIAYGEVPAGDHDAVRVSLMEKDGFVLEFVRLAEADHDAIRSRRDGIIDHIALDVLDADRAYEELKAAGMHMIEDAPVPLPLFDKGVKYFMIRGPEGEKVEFNEMVK